MPDLGGGPSPRGEVCGGFADGTLVVLGGDEGNALNCNPNPKPVADAWTFGVCSGWSALDAGGVPPRTRAASVTDDNGRVFIYGGRFRTSASGNYDLRGDLWQWDKPGGWQVIDDGTAGPKARSSTVLAVDPVTGFLWLHGGNASASGASFSPLSDTWWYDPAAGAWQKLTTTGKVPAARIMHAGAITRDGKYLVIFSGGDAQAFTGPFLADTWRLDLATHTWTQLAKTGPQPKARIFASMVATGGSDLLVFGGHDDGEVGNRNDVWKLDAEAGIWTQLRAGDLGADGTSDTINQPANAPCDFPGNFMAVDLNSPERRESALWTWDTKTGKAWLFGGKSDCGTLRDVWAFDPASATWTGVDDSPKGWSCLRYSSPCSHLCGGG